MTPNAASKTYGTADPALTGTLSGFLAADGVTAVYSRTAGETVAGGPYQQWIFNISTKPLSAQTTYVYAIGLNDGPSCSNTDCLSNGTVDTRTRFASGVKPQRLQRSAHVLTLGRGVRRRPHWFQQQRSADRVTEVES